MSGQANGANGTAPLPPQSIESEESVLGAMMIAEGRIPDVLADVRLKGDDFYRTRHRVVFEAIEELYERGDSVDPLTVAEALAQRGKLEDAGGRDAVSNLASSVPVAGNAKHYAQIVKENALLRRLIDASLEIRAMVDSRDGEPLQLAERAEQLLFQVAHADHQGDFKALEDILEFEISRLEKLASGEAELTGTPSGFVDLDALTGGFQPGNLVVIAARPSMGKSALVANIAESVSLDAKRPVAFFSLEMSEMELAQRFIASQANVDGDKLRKGKVGEREWKKVIKASNHLHGAPLFIDDSSDISLLELRAKARRLHSQHEGGLGCVIVDYLQLMRDDGRSNNRVEIVSAFSRGLKILARELNVPVLAISQLSRSPESRPDKRPMLSDLRESGQIEQDADLVLFLYRHEYYEQEEAEQEGVDGTAELIAAKHRNGPTGMVRLAFLKELPKFRDLARERDAMIAAKVAAAEADANLDKAPW